MSPLKVWTLEVHGEDMDWNPGVVSVWATAEKGMEATEVYYRSIHGDEEPFQGIEWRHTDNDVDAWEGHVLDWDEWIYINLVEVQA